MLHFPFNNFFILLNILEAIAVAVYRLLFALLARFWLLLRSPWHWQKKMKLVLRLLQGWRSTIQNWAPVKTAPV